MDIENELLEAWIKLSNVLRNDRYVESMSFNEIVILRFLINNQESKVQVKDITEYTKMQKSLVNRTLNSLELDNSIERIREKDNRKNVYVKITDSGRKKYFSEHENTKKIASEVLIYLSEEEALNFINYMEKASEIIERMGK